MSKLDFELLQQAPSFLNAVRDRELDLRGNKFQRIENLILTKDQHDTLNVTDNDLRILDNNVSRKTPSGIVMDKLVVMSFHRV